MIGISLRQARLGRDQSQSRQDQLKGDDNQEGAEIDRSDETAHELAHQPQPLEGDLKQETVQYQNTKEAQLFLVLVPERTSSDEISAQNGRGN